MHPAADGICAGPQTESTHHDEAQAGKHQQSPDYATAGGPQGEHRQGAGERNDGKCLA
jgi:alpha/beta superfamily hydrolase